MHSSTQAQRSDVEALVIDKFQSYLGMDEEPSLSSELVADLGIDSIALVTILLDLAEELGLDLGAAQVELGEIQTPADVIDVVGSLQPTTRSDDDA